MNASELWYCSNCWMPNTRPRITFNKLTGLCNSCDWSNEKKNINWQERQDFFRMLVDKYKKCIVPWSGGKDSIYVAYKMREFGLEPLLITVLPHLETEIGHWNRRHLCPNFERLEIGLNEEKYRSLAKKYFIEQGRPKHPWETAISAIIIRKASDLDIPLIVYGEEGEQEYGGVSREKDRWMLPVDKQYLMSYYWQNNLDWRIPTDEQLSKMFFTQWSRFENWQPSVHANFAIAKGMRTEPVRSIGTLTTSSQLSDKLQDLHCYLMFLKFGFGRCSADVSIAIRDGWMERDEGLEWIEHWDGEFANKYLQDYLDYFKMTYNEFCDVLAKHVNKEILEQAKIPGCRHIWNLQKWVIRKRRQNTKLEYLSPERY